MISFHIGQEASNLLSCIRKAFSLSPLWNTRSLCVSYILVHRQFRIGRWEVELQSSRLASYICNAIYTRNGLGINVTFVLWDSFKLGSLFLLFAITIKMLSLTKESEKPTFTIKVSMKNLQHPGILFCRFSVCNTKFQVNQ